MKVLVCVTTQKKCDRLIEAGRDLLVSPDDHMLMVHIAHYELTSLGDSDNADALEYLYATAFEYGVNLMVIRSNDVARTVVDQIKELDVDCVVLGESRGALRGEDIAGAIEKAYGDKIDLHVIALK